MKMAKNAVFWHFLARQMDSNEHIALIQVEFVGLHVGNTSVITEMAKLHL